MARDRRIGMIQPRDRGLTPALYDVGCLGRIADVEALEDGRYNIVLEGIARFRVQRELEVTTPFRQIEAEIESLPQDGGVLASIERAALEQEARRFAESQGYAVDWNARSEEHTSELQSLMRISYAVFCLNKKITQPKHRHQ